jgi:glycerate 2-kinase
VRVVVCLDKFRGSLDARSACAAVAAGLTRTSAARVVAVPMADGGEGTVDALVEAGYTRIVVTVQDARGEPLLAAFAVRGPQAVIEMAQASGHAPPGRRPQPLLASTYGTGQLVSAALDRGPADVVITAGGSGTTDGGAGLLQALGARLLDAAGQPLPPGGAALAQLASADLSGLDPRLAEVRIVVATDVDNPLLGPTGAATVFGPQKGASAEDVVVLEAGLTRLADVLEPATGRCRRDAPGAGAAGGLGFGAMAGLGAERISGAEFLSTELGLPAAIHAATLVIVGEGRLDAQSRHGKALAVVAELARRAGVPVVAVAGDIQLDAAELAALNVRAGYSLLARAGDQATAMRRAAELLTEIGADLGQQLTDGWFS